MSRSKISVKNLCKKFGKNEVLKGVDFEISEGESIVILGGSGCGKSVLIKLLSCLLKPTSGLISINDGEFRLEEITPEQEARYIKKISYLFQLNALFDSMPIWKNIAITKIENEGMKKEAAVELAKKYLKSVDLPEESAFLYPKDLSGGMQKRVAFARAICSNPEIIFFDEPTTGLDPLTSLKIANLIKDLRSDEGSPPITKISIMHDIDCAKIVADRFIYLLNGKVEWQGSPQDLEAATNPNLRRFLGLSAVRD